MKTKLMFTLMILLLCISVGTAGESEKSYIYLPLGTIITDEPTHLFPDILDESTDFFIEAEGYPNIVETVVDSVCVKGRPIYSVYTKYPTWYPQSWEYHTHHYLKLRINGEVYRIELIKEGE